MEAYKMETLINDYLSDHHFFSDGIEVVKSGNGYKVGVYVNQGDWKHEHLHLEHLMEDFFNSHDLFLSAYCEDVQEEDGSDCYSAVHIWVVWEE